MPPPSEKRRGRVAADGAAADRGVALVVKQAGAAAGRRFRRACAGDDVRWPLLEMNSAAESAELSTDHAIGDGQMAVTVADSAANWRSTGRRYRPSCR